MTVQITLEVPDQLGRELDQYRERLPELLERGLREIRSEAADREIQHKDVEEIVEVLASQPTPEQILSLRPSPALQKRMSALLAKSKTERLSEAESTELERYLTLEHIVRIAKSYALQKKATDE